MKCIFYVGLTVVPQLIDDKLSCFKPYGYSGRDLNIPVCNATFFANLIAWPVKAAEESGINSGK